jgi:hypothetical protein
VRELGRARPVDTLRQFVGQPPTGFGFRQSYARRFAMPTALTKDTAIWTIVSLGIGSFVSGMLFMLALKYYFQNDATYFYLFLFLIFPLHIFSSIVNMRRIVKAIP